MATFRLVMPVGTMAKLLYVIGVALVLAQFCLVSGFSDGRKLAIDDSATRKMYCHRRPAKRFPIHFDTECNGACVPNKHGSHFYSISISSSTYWLDSITVNISAKPESGKSVTGFAMYMLDRKKYVAGSFVADDKDVIVGTCSDTVAYSDEAHAAFHKMADRNRKEVSIEWQPDGYNHGPVRAVVWIVNNHSDIYYMESERLTCRRNGSYSLDLETTLHKLSDVDMENFERSFKYRSKLGYHLKLDDPFSPFQSESPIKVELVPVVGADLDKLLKSKLVPTPPDTATTSTTEAPQSTDNVVPRPTSSTSTATPATPSATATEEDSTTDRTSSIDKANSSGFDSSDAFSASSTSTASVPVSTTPAVSLVPETSDTTTSTGPSQPSEQDGITSVETTPPTATTNRPTEVPTSRTTSTSSTSTNVVSTTPSLIETEIPNTNGLTGSTNTGKKTIQTSPQLGLNENIIPGQFLNHENGVDLDWF